MSSASAKVASSEGGDSGAVQGEGGGEGRGEMGTGRDARDPVTGEGIWMDEEDEVCMHCICMTCGCMLSASHSRV